MPENATAKTFETLRPRLHGAVAALAGSHPHRFGDLEDEHLAVADFTRAGCLVDYLQDSFDEFVGNDGLDLDFGKEIDGVGGTPPVLLDAALRTVPLYICDSHTRNADLCERRTDIG